MGHRGAEPAAALRRARLSACTGFAACGAATGTWGARLPALEHQLALGPGALGLVMAAFPAGIIAGVQVTPAVVRRVTSAATSRWALVLAAVSLACLPMALNGVQLSAVLFAHGCAAGAADCTLNTQGSAVQHACGRPVLVGMHGVYSAGAFAAAAGAAVAAAGGAGLAAHFTFAAGVIAAAALTGMRGLLGRDADQPRAARPPAGTGPAKGARILAAAGLVAAASLMVEGSADTWSSVLARSADHASLAVAALAPAAANFGMMAGRLCGAPAVARLGERGALTAGALAACAAQCLAGLAVSGPATVAAYALLGAGCAPVVPLAYAAAARVPGMRPAQSIARATTAGYAGQLAGPVIVGLASSRTSLPLALGLPALLLLGSAAFAAPAFPARRARARSPRHRQGREVNRTEHAGGAKARAVAGGPQLCEFTALWTSEGSPAPQPARLHPAGVRTSEDTEGTVP